MFRPNGLSAEDGMKVTTATMSLSRTPSLVGVEAVAEEAVVVVEGAEEEVALGARVYRLGPPR